MTMLRYAMTVACPATSYRTACQQRCVNGACALDSRPPAPCCLLPPEHPASRVAAQLLREHGYRQQ